MNKNEIKPVSDRPLSVLGIDIPLTSTLYLVGLSEITTQPVIAYLSKNDRVYGYKLNDFIESDLMDELGEQDTALIKGFYIESRIMKH